MGRSSGRLASRLRLRYLVLLLQVARQGSLTRAAEALGFSQPAASKALKELESLFGAPLFLRSASGLTPTALGMLALRRARDLFQDMDNWEHEAEAVRSGSLAHLNVGAIPSVSGHLLATVIGRVRALHNVTISLHRATSDQLVGLLRQHELDCMIGRATVIEAGDDFNQKALYTQRPVLIANVELARRLRGSGISLHKLAGMDWILPSFSTPTGRMIIEIFARADVQPPFPKIETYSPDVIEDLLQSSPDYLSLVAEDIAVDICRNRKVARIPFEFDERLPPISLIRRRREAPVPVEEYFAQILYEACADMPFASGRHGPGPVP